MTSILRDFLQFPRWVTNGGPPNPGLLARPEGCPSGPTTPATDHTKSKDTVGAMFTVQTMRMSCQIFN